MHPRRTARWPSGSGDIRFAPDIERKIRTRRLTPDQVRVAVALGADEEHHGGRNRDSPVVAHSALRASGIKHPLPQDEHRRVTRLGVSQAVRRFKACSAAWTMPERRVEPSSRSAVPMAPDRVRARPPPLRLERDREAEAQASNAEAV